MNAGSAVGGAGLWPAHTERLTIRPYAPDDLDAVWSYRRLPEVFEWLPADFSDRERFVALMAEPERRDRTLVVSLADTGTVVGDLYLHVGADWAQAEVADQAAGRHAEVGWVLDPAYGGRGYATEAASALLRICFEELGVRRTTATCFAANEASWRLMERLGMRREQYGVRDSLHRTRGWLDGLTYALLVEEWRG